MKKIFTRNVPNHEASRKLARELFESYLPKDQPFCVMLEGGLGAGKTFIAKALLEQFGVTQEITSPTYALVNEYTSEQGHFAHWDFYRLEDPNDFFARGFQDLAGDTHCSHFVEWPEQLDPSAKSCFTGERFVLKIQFGIGVGMRKVTLLKPE